MRKTAKNPTSGELRKFGLTMAVAFGGLSLLLWCREIAWAGYVMGAAVFFLGSALLLPRALAPLEKGWMAFAEVLSGIMTRVILVLTFYLVLTPLGLLLRLMGKDLLSRKPDQNRSSYWEPVEEDGPGTRPDKPY